MRIQPNHIAQLAEHIATLDTAESRAKYIAYDVAHPGEIKNLDLRYRWDVYWAIPSDVRYAVNDAYGHDLKDAHIDSALRSIIPPLRGVVLR